nr:rap1 GTPase-activating protein 2-like isoform X2 [Salvelinus alpinus]
MFSTACKGSVGESRIDKSTIAALKGRKQELLTISNVPLGDCPPSPPRTAPPTMKSAEFFDMLERMQVRLLLLLPLSLPSLLPSLLSKFPLLLAWTW